jgi:hypothetical protein
MSSLSMARSNGTPALADSAYMLCTVLLADSKKTPLAIDIGPESYYFEDKASGVAKAFNSSVRILDTNTESYKSSNMLNETCIAAR